MISWLALLFVLEAGLMPSNGWIDNEMQEHFNASPAFYVLLDGEAVISDMFFIGGYVQTTMMKKKGKFGFNPFQDTYQFKVGARFGKLEMGFRHVCGPHPVHTYPSSQLPQPVSPFEGGYEQIYIQINNY